MFNKNKAGTILQIVACLSANEWLHPGGSKLEGKLAKVTHNIYDKKFIF